MDQSYSTDQVRYKVMKPYKCYSHSHVHALDASRDPIIDMQYVPGDSFSRVGGFLKKPVKITKTKRWILNGVPESIVLSRSNLPPEVKCPPRASYFEVNRSPPPPPSHTRRESDVVRSLADMRCHIRTMNSAQMHFSYG